MWVVPEKFTVLKALHPHVKWIIRIHSNIPFLANEGIGIEWIINYIQQENVYVGCNSELSYRDLIVASLSQFNCWSKKFARQKLLYLPNYYPTNFNQPVSTKHSDILNIGCFGAIRPLKNQLLQAIAAISYADQENKTLYFHINADRCEQDGNNNYKNIVGVFEHSRHQLICHRWLDHDNFLNLLSTMDLSMTVSFSETFCIVAADGISQGIPLVTSKEIPWSIKQSQADPTNLDSMHQCITAAVNPRLREWYILENQNHLKKYSYNSEKIWLELSSKNNL